MKNLCLYPRRTLLAFLLLSLLALTPGCHTKKAPFEGKSVAELESMLADNSPTVQAQGAIGLGNLGKEAEPAVPKLIDALKCPESLVRQNAAQALGKIAPKSQPALTPLIDLLKDPEWTVRRQAALAIGQFRGDGQPALTALEQLARDPDPQVRNAAKRAIDMIKKSNHESTKDENTK
jgi:HEAT repeat protein